ncbi:Uncharacterized membrane protein YgdD, TMEM256/DUF423 family [Lutibacter oricola]|uniref:Uncharacterized membrane protein YgdD, TMEM256/DUF423 family n=1 Tax=Lutibacter oricola TaxID=762486 RepID=A0A1H2U004_9FLAO|nr:DUF423 domain-containing protein [Lutibacter oricola]SDW49555.1 Uncharacterized membrane protein YgdD, TMEM256/DUF423 family [Lutibacter oricola]
MNRNLLIVCLLGAITILLGAFGAHSLQKVLSALELKSFETAVRYQMYHVLMLLFVNSFAKISERNKNRITLIVLLGIGCFSGSIYAITFGVSAKQIWFVTPLGGMLLFIGWIYLGFSLFRSYKM